jgi:hypothetical protein
LPSYAMSKDAYEGFSAVFCVFLVFGVYVKNVRLLSGVVTLRVF